MGLRSFWVLYSSYSCGGTRLGCRPLILGMTYARGHCHLSWNGVWVWQWKLPSALSSCRRCRMIQALLASSKLSPNAAMSISQRRAREEGTLGAILSVQACKHAHVQQPSFYKIRASLWVGVARQSTSMSKHIR